MDGFGKRGAVAGDVWWKPVRILGGVVLLTVFVLTAMRRLTAVVTVVGDSMTPTLKHGDRVLVVRRWLGKPRIGDVVVIADYAGVPGERSVLAIKRVVGRSGDPLPENFRPSSKDLSVGPKATSGETVPSRCFAVSSDSAGGLDSRVWGPVPEEKIYGKVIAQLPAERWTRAEYLAEVREWRVSADGTTGQYSGPRS
jgi:signal peptidase I